LPDTVSLTAVERGVLDARLSGLSIGQMSEAELKVATDQIILRGAAITGCDLPATSFFADIISDEVAQLLSMPTYQALTEGEIILAMRFNSQGNTPPDSTEVKFSGKTFYIGYLARVLENYMALRNLFDRKLQNVIDGY
jgi:hypothetical protein